jgi:SecD/SecF fusion protein
MRSIACRLSAVFSASPHLFITMNHSLTFLIGLSLLALFAWYFLAHKQRVRRNVATVLSILTVALSLLAIYPLEQTIRLGLDLQGGTSFLVRLLPEGEREITTDNLDHAVEVIKKRVDQFGVSERAITPHGTDRILVQIPGLGPEQIAAAWQQLAQVAKLEFRLIHPRPH